MKATKEYGVVKTCYFCSFITSALDGSEWSGLPDHLTAVKEPLYLLNRRLSGSQKLSEREVRVSYPYWESKHGSSGAKPIALSLTDDAIPALFK